MSLISDVTKKTAVKSMTLPETIGAGIIGGVVNGIVTGFTGNLPAWVNPAIQIVGGMVGGGVIGGSVGSMLQSGLVISGMAKVSDYIVSAGKNLIGGMTAAPVADNSPASMY